MIAPVAVSTALPSAPFAAPAFHICMEAPGDAVPRDALLDRAMGPGRRRKASEAIRRGRLPAEGLALVAKSEAGTIIGSVRLWNVAAGETGLPALLLGPLAVMPELAGCGIGSALMRRAVAEAHWRGHAAILLVGDPDYYARFGFSAVPAAGLAMPGPFERHRMLGLEITPGALAGAQGLIRPTGRRTASTGSQKTAVAPQARPSRQG